MLKYPSFPVFSCQVMCRIWLPVALELASACISISITITPCWSSVFFTESSGRHPTHLKLVPLHGRMRIFELFPIVLAIAVVWSYGAIVTAAGVYDNSPADVQKACRTDQTDVLARSPWFRVPYPGQWGRPVFTVAAVFTMLAGAISAMVESVGGPFNHVQYIKVVAQ